MNLNLSFTFYKTLKFFIWAIYLLFFFKTLKNGSVYEILFISFLSFLLIHLTIIPFIDNWYRYNRPNLLDWFRLTTFFVLIFDCFRIIYFENFNDLASFPEYRIPKKLLIPSLITIFIGLVGLKIGEVFIKNISANKTFIKNKSYKLKNKYLFFILTILIGITQLILLIKGEVGYGTFQENTTSDLSFLFKTLEIISFLILSIFSVLRYIFKNKDLKFNFFFCVFFLIQILFGLLSGMKESILTPIIIVVIPFIIGGYKISKKAIIIFAFLTLIIYPLNDNYRQILNTFPNISKFDAVLIGMNLTKQLDLYNTASLGGESFLSRLSLFPYLVYAVENESTWSYYKNMKRYLFLPVSWFIPRFLIPNKPKSDIGAKFNDKVHGGERNSLTATTYGWAYFEGGYLFVFIVFLLFGLFIAFFQYRIDFSSFFGNLIYIVILIKLLKIEEDVYFLIAGILQSVFIYYYFLKLFVKKV